MGFSLKRNNAENIEQLKHTRVAVLGAARSGLAVIQLLRSVGAGVFLSEVKSAEALGEMVEKIRDLQIPFELSGHSTEVLQADLICISPGIPLEIPILRAAQKQGIPIVGELELASWFISAPLVAITGSNGKTTTTTLIGNILNSFYENVIVAGNIGEPLATKIMQVSNPTHVVLEVSSFQLETIVNFRPQIAVIMNISPNHLDRYPDMDAYVRAKMRIVKNMDISDILIYNQDDAFLSELVREIHINKIPFSIRTTLPEGAYWENNVVHLQTDNLSETIPLSDYQLRGPHNRYNMLVATLISRLLGVPERNIQKAIGDFPGIEHRLEKVAEIDGVMFINDSKATTVESLKYALQSFTRPIVLIAGGKDKGGDFAEITDLLKQKVRAAILIGQAADRMAQAWEKHIPLHRAASLKEAVELSRKVAQSSDVVLLSPACSSFDMFQDYEDRGRQFKKLVRQLNSEMLNQLNH